MAASTLFALGRGERLRRVYASLQRRISATLLRQRPLLESFSCRNPADYHGEIDQALALTFRGDAVCPVKLTRAVRTVAIAVIMTGMLVRTGRDSQDAFRAVQGDLAQVGGLICAEYAQAALPQEDVADLLDLLARLSPLELAVLLNLSYERLSGGLLRPGGAGSRRITRGVVKWESKLRGLFFTPPFIAAAIGERTVAALLEPQLRHIREGRCQAAAQRWRAKVLRLLQLRLVDPACGAGILLLAALEALRSTYSAIRAEVEAFNAAALSLGLDPVWLPETDADFAQYIVQRNLYGVDVDPACTLLTRYSLACTVGLPHPACLQAHACTGNSLVLDWQATFPDVFAAPDGGFDALVMNPPYERLKVKATDFRLPGETAPDVQEVLRQLHQRILAAVEAEKRFYRKSGRYRLSLAGTLDRYCLMLELSCQITRPVGAVVGCIVPSTILGDHSTRRIRSHLLHHCRMLGIYEFPETAQLFRGVNQATAILCWRTGERSADIPLAAGLDNPEALTRAAEVPVPLRLIRQISGEAMAIPNTSQLGWRIVERLHRFPTISQIASLHNLRGELDVTKCRGALSWGATGARLLRGCHVERYTFLDAPEKESFVRLAEFVHQRGRSVKREHIGLARIVGRQCAYLRKERRLSFTLSRPGYVVANSCNYLFLDPAEGSEEATLYLLALLNSHLLDWRFKLTSSNNHVSNYELDRLPIVWPAPPGITATVASVVRQRLSGDPLKSEALEAHLDAWVFAVYGLAPAEACFVLQQQKASAAYTAKVLKEWASLDAATGQSPDRQSERS